MNNKKTRYSEILPNKNDWPIVKLSKNRKSFSKKIVKEAYNKILKRSQGRLREELEMTIHREKVRVKVNPWKVDPPDESVFWKKLQQKLTNIGIDDQNNDEEKARILKSIIQKYVKEISGKFRKKHYQFAVSFVTFGFARLLNVTRVKGLLSLFSKQLDLDDKIHVVGETEGIRALAQKGTLVMVPTHFSNLDSILIGWVIQYLGLPAFTYGAGLNLFNIKILAYFMNSLGTYKVDRRKKNSLYLETLKIYSKLNIKEGCHSLFFPGGTRSRSGQIETQLKTGLLSTTIRAQREMYQEAKEGEKVKKVFIIPVVINYNFTLEAPSLIQEHLRKTGKERYYREADEFSTSYKIFSFLFKFFTKGSNISVNIGKGMDILGNYVNNEGRSYDKNNNEISTRDYFLKKNQITLDKQREHEYSRVLANRIVEEYYKYNRVFASHIVAFVAFKMLEKRNPKLDLYDILRLSDEDLELDYKSFIDIFIKIKNHLEEIHRNGKVDLASHMKQKPKDCVLNGIKNLGLYHSKRPLILKRNRLIIQDTNTLYYYHNRMNGYELEKYI